MTFFDDECLVIVKTAIPYLLSERGRSACQKAVMNGDEDLRELLNAASGIDWSGMLLGSNDEVSEQAGLNNDSGSTQATR